MYLVWHHLLPLSVAHIPPFFWSAYVNSIKLRSCVASRWSALQGPSLRGLGIGQTAGCCCYFDGRMEALVGKLSNKSQPRSIPKSRMEDVEDNSRNQSIYGQMTNTELALHRTCLDAFVPRIFGNMFVSFTLLSSCSTLSFQLLRGVSFCPRIMWKAKVQTNTYTESSHC